MRKWIHCSSLIIFIISTMSIAVLAKTSTVEGFVKDAKTGEPLFGANLILVGTSMGAATGINGRYVIPNTIPGSYTIRVSYIGYQTKEVKLIIKDGEKIEKNFDLEPVGVIGQTVVITSQANGQIQAINKELSSDQIENVVSAAKIHELPDANAAESVGRLPGVFVVRSGGEGYQVSIRGLQPKYNQVTIDGIRMGAADPNDRSTDLSMISSDMLEGIEVKKTVTPDMDADVIGGVVNFDMREAQVQKPGIPVFNFLAQGGYNNLPDANNKYNNYKYVVSAQDRLLDDRFGIFAEVSMERRNLTANQLSASYDQLNNSTTSYRTTELSLFYLPRDRQRYNGALNLDFKLPDGKIKLINFVSTSNTNSRQAENNFLISNTAQSYQLGNTSSDVNNIINAIDFEEQLAIFHLDAKLSHTYSETKSPNNWGVVFTQGSQGLAQFINQPNINPQNVPKAGNNNFSNAYLSTITRDNSFSRQRVFTASLDITTNLNFSDDFNTQIKFGGKYAHQIRSYAYDQYNSEPLNEPGDLFVDNLISQYFSIPVNSYNIPMTYFIDPSFNYGKFLGGDYKLVAPLNPGMMSRMVDLLQNNVQYLAQNNHPYSYSYNDYASLISNYSGYENHSAIFGMVTAKLGSQITLITGARFQNLQTVYTGVRGLMTTSGYQSYEHYDTTVTQNHGYLLPDLSIRYKPLSWFDARLSYSNTLAYPDYNSIIPKIDMNGLSINWVNYKLIPSRSANYDAYFSFYNNTIGLFTAGAFLKQINNLIYPWSFYVSGANVQPYLPASLVTKYNPNGSYNITTFLNDSYRVNDYGLELDWQTHLWYLPGMLSGFVLGVNYTHVFSRAQYPYTYRPVTSTGRTLAPVDTSYLNPLIDQPNNIVNLSVGFDYRDFSIRVAFLYQSDVFTGPNFWPQLRSYTAPYRRWDLAAKQELPWFGVQVFGDVNNINGANDVGIIQGGGVPISEQDYGLTADLGLRFKL
ncbi:MAG: TonB-dependent receptor [Ignavibacteriaceae bacterium]